LVSSWPESPGLKPKVDLLAGCGVNREWNDCLALYFIWNQDQPAPMPSYGYYTLRGRIEVAFFRELHDLLDDGQVKASQASPIF
jgi:hypothetical protein